MELSLGDIAAVVIYFLLIIGIGLWVGDILLTGVTNHHLTLIILFYFSLWCGPTAGRWRDISWLGSSCSGCLLEPLCLQEILAANTSLVWRAQELRPASVSELSSSM